MLFFASLHISVQTPVVNFAWDRLWARSRCSVSLRRGEWPWSYPRWLAERGHPPGSIGAAASQPLLCHCDHGTRPSAVLAGAWNSWAVRRCVSGRIFFWSSEFHHPAASVLHNQSISKLHAPRGISRTVGTVSADLATNGGGDF